MVVGGLRAGPVVDVADDVGRVSDPDRHVELQAQAALFLVGVLHRTGRQVGQLRGLATKAAQSLHGAPDLRPVVRLDACLEEVDVAAVLDEHHVAGERVGATVVHASQRDVPHAHQRAEVVVCEGLELPPARLVQSDLDQVGMHRLDCHHRPPRRAEQGTNDRRQAG